MLLVLRSGAGLLVGHGCLNPHAGGYCDRSTEPALPRFSTGARTKTIQTLLMLLWAKPACAGIADIPALRAIAT